MGEPRSVGEAVEAGSGVTVEAPSVTFTPKGEKGGPTVKDAPGLPDEPKDLDTLPKWREQDVKAALRAMTATANGAAGERVGAQLTMTDDELRAIAPALTNIINRNPMLRGMASASDAVTAALGLLGYVMRVGAEASDTRRERAKEAQRELDAQQSVYEPIAIDNGGGVLA